MGKHGPGAPKAEYVQKKKGPGRPRKQAAAEVVDLFREEAKKTRDFLVRIRDSEDEQTRDRIAAARLITAIMVLDPSPQVEADEGQEPMTVALVPDWRAPGK